MSLAVVKNWRKDKVVIPEGHKVPEGFLLLRRGVYRDCGNDDIKMIAAAPFYISGRMLNRERGET
ncbi:MAG: hypothetical protein ACYCX4_18255 [Bacillota bacterium]